MLASSFSAGPGVKLDLLPNTEQGNAAPGTFTVVATANQTRSPNTLLATVTLPSVDDAVVEASETFTLSLGGFITPTAVTTTITDNDVAPPVQPPAQPTAQPPFQSPGQAPPSVQGSTPPRVESVEISLRGRRSVREGRTTKPFAVSLGNSARAAGESVTFQLGAQGRSALSGRDFNQLTARRLRAGSGLELGLVTSRPDGLIEVTATNISGQAQGNGTTLASFSIRTRQDRRREGRETFRVDLSSASARVGRARSITTIRDDDRRPGGGSVTPSPTVLSPPPRQPARLPRGTFGDNFVFGSGGLASSEREETPGGASPDSRRIPLAGKLPRRIGCIGAAMVGGPTMAAIADRCPQLDVTVVDLNSEWIGLWNHTGLSRLAVYAVGLDAVVARGHTFVVEKSTLPARTAQTVKAILGCAEPGQTFAVFSNPKSLAEGEAVADLEAPDRVLIGTMKTVAPLVVGADSRGAGVRPPLSLVRPTRAR